MKTEIIVVPLSRKADRSAFILVTGTGATDREVIHQVPSDGRVLWDEVHLRVGGEAAPASSYSFGVYINDSGDVHLDAQGGEGWLKLIDGMKFFPGDTISLHEHNGTEDSVGHGWVHRCIRVD